MLETVFTWDPAKAETNLRKHEISFERAVEAFDDPFQVVGENDLTDDEQRYSLIGMTRGLMLLLVIFVDRSSAEAESLRLISARRADEYERKIYSAHLQTQNH